MVSQSHQLREDSLVKSAQQAVRSERSQELEERDKVIKEMAPKKTKRALYPATEKSSLAWRISKRNRSIVCIRKRRNVCIQEEFSTLSMERLRPWCLQQLVVRERIPKVSQSTSRADFHQERRTKQRHG